MIASAEILPSREMAPLSRSRPRERTACCITSTRHTAPRRKPDSSSAADTNFYGTASDGGANGDGVIFKLAPDGGYTVLFDCTDAMGASPEGALVAGADGDFYGTAALGGANGMGALFKITSAGEYTLLHSFSRCGWAPAGDGPPARR